jgi:hypothetical protein
VIFRGQGADIEVESDYLTITRRGVLSALTVGFQGSKKIYIGDITAVQFKDAGLILNGYIHFSFMGGQEVRGGILDHVNDENTVVFRQGHSTSMRELKLMVEQRIAELRSAQRQNNVAAPSPADELAKFAQLRDQGVITAAEFEAKKKQLLGL